MKQVKYTVISVLALALMAGSTIAQAGDNNKALTVSAQQTTVTVTLPSNATTGYQWFVTDYDHHLLELKNYQYQAPNNGKMGAPGAAVFKFTALSSFTAAPQLTKINFVYARAWDVKENPKAHTVNVISLPASQ